MPSIIGDAEAEARVARDDVEPTMASIRPKTMLMYALRAVVAGEHGDGGEPEQHERESLRRPERQRPSGEQRRHERSSTTPIVPAMNEPIAAMPSAGRRDLRAIW